MAAAERICQWCGHHAGWQMYDHKHNHIQICPHHRSAFKNASAVLHIFQPGPYDIHRRSGRDMMSAYHVGEWQWSGFRNEHEYLAEYNIKLVYRRQYVLEVKGPDHAGIVDGLYQGDTYEIGTMLRRIRRLVNNKKLKIVRHNMTYRNWWMIRTKHYNPTIEMQNIVID